MSAGGGKSFSFVSGVLLGMLAAIGLVFLIMNDFNPLNLVNDKEETNSGDTLVDLRNNKAPTTRKNRKNNSTLQKEDYTNKNDSFAFQNDTETVKISLTDEDIIVRRDELLESRSLELIVLDGKAKSNKSDSLLKLIDNNGNEKTQFKIEFWKSPINYRGFKMIRNNIIAFGLETSENCKLFSYEQQYYLKHGSSIYKVYLTSDFQSFTKINDESIIKLMR